MRVDGLRSVSPHVQVIPDNSVPLVPNVGFVVGTKGVLVVDTGLGPRNGAAVAAVASASRGAGGLSGDHPRASRARSGRPGLSRRAQVDPLQGSGGRRRRTAARLAKVFAGRSPAIAELLKDAEFRPADMSFDRRRTLDLGGVQARIVALGPNHTAGDTVVWVAADKVLFSGDVAMKPQPSMMAAGTTDGAVAGEPRSAGGAEAAVVVPEPRAGGDVGLIQGYRAYLKEVAGRDGQGRRPRGPSLEAPTARSPTQWRALSRTGAVAGAVRVAYAGQSGR